MRSPAEASGAVKSAFECCFWLILPSLLPFFFASGILNGLGFAEILSKNVGKILRKTFKLPEKAAAALVMGFLGGYPIGAACITELVVSGSLSKNEAEKLLPVCNNTGPAFIIGAVGNGIFQSAAVGVLLYICHIAAALTLSLIFCREYTEKPETHSAKESFAGLSASLTKAVKGSMDKSLAICGFVVFFFVLSAMLEEVGLISSFAIFLNRTVGLEIGFCRSLTSGLLELGCGIASMGTLAPRPGSYALAAFVLGFGSLSVHCQTAALACAENIKCARHFAGRILHGTISALYIFVLTSLFRI